MRVSGSGRVADFRVVVKSIRVHGAMVVAVVSFRVAMIEINAQLIKILEIFKPKRVLIVSG
jgi:hypothetical protein